MTETYVEIFECTYQRVYDAARLAAMQCDFQIDTENANEGMIKASTKASLLSWGEDININISSVSNGVEVIMSSDAPGQFFDWGKNMENVNCFFEKLESCLEG